MGGDKLDRKPMPPHKKMSDGIAAPKSIKELPVYVIKKIKNFLTHFFYVISLVWQAAPALLVFMSLCCILEGVFPVLGAYISRDLINEISDLIIKYACDSMRACVFLPISQQPYAQQLW